MKKSVLFTVFVVLATSAQADFQSQAKKSIKASATPTMVKKSTAPADVPVPARAIVQEPNTPLEIVFYDKDGLVIGRLSWYDKKMKFDGQTEASADAFFRHIIPLLRQYIDAQCKEFK